MPKRLTYSQLFFNFVTNSAITFTSVSLSGSSKPMVSMTFTGGFSLSPLKKEEAKTVLWVQEVADSDTGKVSESKSWPTILLHRADFPVPVFPMIKMVLKGQPFRSFCIQ